jgi:hypothetical protein
MDRRLLIFLERPVRMLTESEAVCAASLRHVWDCAEVRSQGGVEMKTVKKSFLAQELSKFFEAAWLDLPAEAARSLLGAGNESGLRQAGWKTYDAWVSLANELTNAFYSDRTIGAATGLAMESTLRLRQIGGTVAAAFFGNLWPAIGLPPQSEITALRDDLLALRAELAAADAKPPIPGESADADIPDKLRIIRNSTSTNGHRAANIDGDMARRSAGQGKRNVAA